MVGPASATDQIDRGLRIAQFHGAPTVSKICRPVGLWVQMPKHGSLNKEWSGVGVMFSVLVEDKSIAASRGKEKSV